MPVPIDIIVVRITQLNSFGPQRSLERDFGGISTGSRRVAPSLTHPRLAVLRHLACGRMRLLLLAALLSSLWLRGAAALPGRLEPEDPLAEVGKSFSFRGSARRAARMQMQMVR